MKNNIKTIFECFKELNYILNSKQKKKIVLVSIVIIISSFFELIGITVILPFIQIILSPEVLFNNPYMGFIIDSLKISTSKELLIWCGIGIILLYIIKNVYILFSYYIQFNFATLVQRDLSVKMFQAYLKKPYTYYLDTNSSELIRGCSNDTMNVYYIVSYLCDIVTQLLTMVLVGGLIICTDPWTALATLLLMSGVLAGIIFGFKPIARRAGKANREADAEKAKVIYETVSGIKEIYVMRREGIFVKAYKKAADIARRAQRIKSFMDSAPDRIIEGICIGGLIGIVCIRLFFDADMASFVPKLAMFAMAAFKVIPSIGKVSSRINGLFFCRPSLAHVYTVMKESDEYEREHEAYAKEKGVIREPDDIHFHGSLMIQNVFWQYDAQKVPVLTETTLEIKKGQSVALIGSSGSGKTTLVDCILGLLRPQKGMIMMDGLDVYAMPHTWSRIVGYVPQAVFLLDDTVRNNVAFGLPAEMIQDEEIWEALEKAQLMDFIKRLPDGLDTIVGERGIKFSGGQKQRIAIARALYNQPEILVLDEATAALDNETETAVMESIDALQGHITMIIVAHRLTTIRNCDQIYEIKEGKAFTRDKKEVLEVAREAVKR